MQSEPVTILGETWHPSLPPSFCVRQEVILAVQRTDPPPIRGMAAALGVCWGASAPLGIGYVSMGYDPMQYGGAVFDLLVSRGATPTDIYQAGALCAVAIARSFPTKAAVDERADFTGASSQAGPAEDAAG